jgi:L-aminopeptidase/D-esterase-like protein
LAGGLQGGVGTASTRVAAPLGSDDEDDIVVGALAVVNAAGNVIDPRSGLPWVADGLHVRRPPARQRSRLAEHLAEVRRLALAPAPLNTTVGVVATSAALTKAEAAKLAAVAHDGLARAVRPAHSMFDGDVVFALATGRHDLPAGPIRYRDPSGRPGRLNALLEAAARCFALACADAVVSARAHPGGALAYRDLCPDAFGNQDDPN